MSNNKTPYANSLNALAEESQNLDLDAGNEGPSWRYEMPEQGVALNLGDGLDKEAYFLASRGLNVVAVKHVDGVHEMAPRYDATPKISWVDDSFPDLKKVFALQMKFDFILLNEPWWHVAHSERSRCIRKLSSLLKPNGKIVVTLNGGESLDENNAQSKMADEFASFASQFGLTYKLISEGERTNSERERKIVFQTVILQLPDDGTGAFPLIRNIVINDSKASTYKIGLLRALLRIAEGHPGAVLEQNEEHIVLPMGLVALYWLKLYKPLVDSYNIQQNGNSEKGLSFITENGWARLTSYTNSDFYLGARYTHIAQYLYQTLKDISSTIKTMPARYTTLPNSKTPVFNAEIFRTKKPNNDLVLNFEFLSSLGRVHVPRHIWDSLTRFSVWIEPALINEWVNLMSGFSLNRARTLNTSYYLSALSWEDPERTTTRVRKRIGNLLSNEAVHCCWSGKIIKGESFAVDHAFPFARWPNNDLWNLLPTTSAINAQKSDKLPTNEKLYNSRQLITRWWQQGWMDNSEEFFTQANFALPNLQPSNRSFDDVFEAFSLQRNRIKDFQRLPDW